MWQVLGVPGSKGQRLYAWAWTTTSARHFLLIRKHLATGELAYHYCHVPDHRPVTLATLIGVACLRSPVEENFDALPTSRPPPRRPGHHALPDPICGSRETRRSFEPFPDTPRCGLIGDEGVGWLTLAMHGAAPGSTI